MPGFETWTLVIFIWLEFIKGGGGGIVELMVLWFLNFLRIEFMCSARSFWSSSFVFLPHFCLMYFRISRIFRGRIMHQLTMKKIIRRPIQINPHTSILLLLCGDIKNTSIQHKNSNHISLFQFKKLLMLSLNGRYFT